MQWKCSIFIHKNFLEAESRNTHADCLDLLKHVIEGQGLFKLDFDEIKNFSVEEIYLKTHCGTTARHIIKLLTDVDINKEHAVCNTQVEEVLILEQEIYNKHVVIEKIREVSNKVKHLLLYTTLCGSVHTFVIEKQVTPESSKCRIYQSWQQSFTLASWLGYDKWVNEECRKDFEEYGAGKWILLEETVQFIEKMLKLCRPRLQMYHEWGFFPSEVKIIGFARGN